MRISEIMTRDPELIDPNASIREAARRMRSENVGALPVAEERNPGTTSVRDVLSEKVFYCFDDDNLEAAAKCMADHQVRRLPVLNRDKRLVGIVSLADIA